MEWSLHLETATQVVGTPHPGHVRQSQRHLAAPVHVSEPRELAVDALSPWQGGLMYMFPLFLQYHRYLLSQPDGYI